MTAQTQSQRNASYRQRQREKMARMSNALDYIRACADAMLRLPVVDRRNTWVMVAEAADQALR